MVYGLLLVLRTRPSGPTYCIGLILKKGLTIQYNFGFTTVHVQQTLFFIINNIKKVTYFKNKL